MMEIKSFAEGMPPEQIKEFAEVVKRNEAIAVMIGFKKYKPANEVEVFNKVRYKDLLQIDHDLHPRWYDLPGVGRYSNMEMKFHSDWNWLLSAFLDTLRKFRYTHWGKFDVLSIYFHKMESITVYEFDKEFIWKKLSDYALELQRIKTKENDKYQTS